MGVLTEPVAFVDIETTGGSYRFGRMTEIAIIRPDPSGEVTKYQTLLNPKQLIPQNITSLTGITNKMVANAPEFKDVVNEIFEILDGCIFFAHVVRFDYSFIKNEFKRAGIDFRPKMLCTVRISRSLYPYERAHNLDAIISRLGLEVADRHRAMADTEVLWEFYKQIHQQFSKERLDQTFKSLLRLQALPPNIDNKLINSLPEAPGVYIFEDEHGGSLYIGKAVNIRERVLSHFNSDYTHSKELKLSQQVKNISFKQTHGELGALLLESEMIKEQQPLYNQKLRRTEEMCPIVKDINENGYFTARISKDTKIDPSSNEVIGVYKTAGMAKKALEQLCNQFYLCPKLVGLERSKNSCFRYQINKCMGACCNQETTYSYNSRFSEAFAHQRIKDWPFEGPIVISEINPKVDGASGYVFDNWCMTGVIKEIFDSVSFEPIQKVFDRDMYAILRSYIANPVRRSNIRMMPKNHSFL